MKKIVVILLLILPFFLIYSISFTGKILSQYTHIYVERIAIADEAGEDYEEGTVLKLAKGATLTLDVRVYPELASNKSYSISNSDKTVCSIDEKTAEVTALAYGSSRITLTALDTSVTFSFTIKVADDDIQEISVNKTDVVLAVGKRETIEAVVLPTTTLAQNRGLVWESADPSIATVNANGTITGVSAGSTVITVRSDYKEDVFTLINVTVEAELEQPVRFNVPAGTYTVNEATLDLNAITVFNVEGYTDLRYEVLSNTSKADLTRLNEGFVTFNASTVYRIRVSVTYEGTLYFDEITVLYNPAA